MPKKACSFCGRTENDVKLLITGLSGYICEDCAAQAYEIVQQSGVWGEDVTNPDAPHTPINPQKKYLNRKK